MTSAIFDFDNIRHRRNQMLGLEPNGRVFDEKGRQIVEADVFFDVPRPLAWRMTQHRAAEHQKTGVAVSQIWGTTSPKLPPPPPTTDALLDSRCRYPHIPEWFAKSYADYRARYRFKPSGFVCRIRGAVISSGSQDKIQRLEAVEIEWDGGMRDTYDGGVFLKNFEPIGQRQ